MHNKTTWNEKLFGGKLESLVFILFTKDVVYHYDERKVC